MLKECREQSRADVGIGNVLPHRGAGEPLWLSSDMLLECLVLLMIAVVEDDDGVRAAYVDLMSSYGYEVRAFSSAEDFISARCQNEVGCLILDHRLPGISGLELLAKMRREKCAVPVVFVTSQDDDQTRSRAFDIGADYFLHKPIDVEDFVKCVLDAYGSNSSTDVNIVDF